MRKLACAAGEPEVGKSIFPSSPRAPAPSAAARQCEREDQAAAGLHLPLDPPCQRRHPAEQPRVERELAAVVFLVGDAVAHPGEAAAHLPVEPADQLKHVQLSRLPEFPLPLRMGLLERVEKLRLRPPGGDSARVLVQEALVGLALEIAV